MSYTRSWLESIGSEDSHARALWALGAVVGRCRDPGKESLAGRLFRRALHTIEEFTSPRAWSFALLGITEYLRAFRGDSNVQASPQAPRGATARAVRALEQRRLAMVRGPGHLRKRPTIPGPDRVRGHGSITKRCSTPASDRSSGCSRFRRWTAISRRSDATASTDAGSPRRPSTSNRSKPGQRCPPAWKRAA